MAHPGCRANVKCLAERTGGGAAKPFVTLLLSLLITFYLLQTWPSARKIHRLFSKARPQIIVPSL
jgi:hypothetical protein